VASTTKPLDLNESGRTWKFAEILVIATEVFGSQTEAEQWNGRPSVLISGVRSTCLRRRRGLNLSNGISHASHSMRKQLRFVSVSGTALKRDDRIELHFVIDPAKNADDVVVEMSRDELKRLHARMAHHLCAEA
jgi:hypothetical protein